MVAASLNGVIGPSKQLPWRILEKCTNFQRLVTGHSVIMGRKTYELLNGRVVGSRNIVLTSQKDFSAPGIEVVRSIEEIFKLTQDESKIFVIGGARVFKKMIDFADFLHVTEVNAVVQGHQIFPEIDSNIWGEDRRSNRQNRIGDLMSYCFVDYYRKKPREQETKHIYIPVHGKLGEETIA